METAKPKFLRIPIGMGVSVVVMAIACNSVVAAGGILIASIICTLGISLLMWIPIWWLLGAIVLDCIDWAGSIGSTPNTQRLGPQPATRDEIALTGYIRRSRRAGVSDAQITHRLREQGWTQAEITAAFAAESSNNQSLT